MFTIDIISDAVQFTNIRCEWKDLLQQSKSNNIFLTWEWLHTWWTVFANQGMLFVVTARNREGKLVGVAPLFIRRSKYYKFPVKELTFIGDGHSDRQDFIISKKYPQVSMTIVSEIYANRSAWDILKLEQIPMESSLLTNDLIVSFSPEVEDSSFCPYVVIGDNWEAYFGSLSKKLRRDIRNKKNRMSKFGKWEFKVDRKVNDIEEMIEEIGNIEAKSRKHNTERAFWVKKRNNEFLVKFCKLCMENNWLDYCKISIDNVPVVCLLGFLYNNKYYAYNIAYTEEFYQASPGKLVLNEKIKWCFEHIDSVKEFDFLRGDTYIKSKWASDSRRHLRMVFFKNSMYSSFVRYAVFRIRPIIKGYLKWNNRK